MLPSKSLTNQQQAKIFYARSIKNKRLVIQVVIQFERSQRQSLGLAAYLAGAMTFLTQPQSRLYRAVSLLV
jgi:hypothetical protein